MGWGAPRSPRTPLLLQGSTAKIWTVAHREPVRPVCSDGYCVPTAAGERGTQGAPAARALCPLGLKESQLGCWGGAVAASGHLSAVGSAGDPELP